jgi:membrane fusion protein, multidrug efflux system
MNYLYKIAFISALFLAIISSYCGKEQKEEKEIIRPVRYQQVFISSGEQTRTFSGISKAGTETRLSFRVGGTLHTLNVKVGDRIKKGQVIAAIDDSDSRLEYQKILDSLNKSLLQKDTAKSNLDRIKSLYENNNVSLREYESAKDQYATANSAYNADKRNEELKKRALSYFKLYSPSDGIVASLHVEKNENIQTGSTIVEINTGDDIEVTVGMPESFISRVKTGETVNVRFSSIKNKVFDGKISEVSYISGSQSSTYPVTITLTAPTQDIRPGMPCEVIFTLSSQQKSDNLIVPANAVGEDTGGNFVFTVTDTGDGFAAVHKKKVTIGTLTREGFEILTGLQDGEQVVTAGIAKLTDGMKVRMLK